MILTGPELATPAWGWRPFPDSLKISVSPLQPRPIFHISKKNLPFPTKEDIITAATRQIPCELDAHWGKSFLFLKASDTRVWWQLVFHSIKSAFLALMSDIRHSEVDVYALVPCCA